jgi:hypothetical protein
MDELSTIPEPQDDPAGKASRRPGGKKRRADNPRQGRAAIASAEDCLAMLSRLPSLVTLGMISTATANTIRSTCTAILQYYGRQQSGPSRTVVNEKDVAKLLRTHPEYAKLFEHLLTDEQIEILVRGGKDDGDADEAA